MFNQRVPSVHPSKLIQPIFQHFSEVTMDDFYRVGLSTGSKLAGLQSASYIENSREM